MKTTKLFGICILFLLAAISVNAAANETYLDELLNSYGSNYDDGSFDVELVNYSYFRFNSTEAGWNSFDFNITGPRTNESYTLVSEADVAFIDEVNFIPFGSTSGETNMTGPGIVTITFDGNDYGDFETVVKFMMNLRIYQKGTLYYHNELETDAYTRTRMAIWDCDIVNGCANNKKIRGVDINSDGKYELINFTLNFILAEKGPYTIGVYVWDNKSSTAYVEKTVTFASASYLVDKNISFIINADELKDFELNNEKIYLKEIVINGHPFGDPFRTLIYNDYFHQSDLFTIPTSFNFTDIYINSYTFDETNIADGKIKTLDVILGAQYYSGSYEVELSLENENGELISIKNETVNSWPARIEFNGTEIYQSKINGPYKIGFIRITKSGDEVLYKINKGESSDLTSYDFTSPPMPDLKINNSDIKGDGKDVNVTLHNVGTGDAVGITISVFDSDAEKIKEIILSNISAGNDYKYIFNDIDLSSAFIFVDFSNSIEETNESNNVAQLIPPNIPPVLAEINDQYINENELLTFAIDATDPDNITLIYSAENLPAGATFVGQTFSWTPSFTQAGDYLVTFKVTDKISIDSETITIHVYDFNRAPTITSTPSSTATRGLQYVYSMIANDLDEDSLIYAVNDSLFAKSGNVFTWTPDDSRFGTRKITFSVTDLKLAPVIQEATISIIEDIYLLRAATLDYNEMDLGNFVYINSNITINSQTENSIGITHADFTVNSNTEYPITHSASGYQSDSDDVYFDERLTTCIENQDCNLAGTYLTNCLWETEKTNWYCGVEGGTLAKKTWFRYERTPIHDVRRVNYLMK